MHDQREPITSIVTTRATAIGGGALGPSGGGDPFAARGAAEVVPMRVGSGGGGFSLAAFLAQKWTMLGIAALVAGLAVPAIWLSLTPVYRAKATVEILPSNPRVLYRTEDNGVLPYHTQFLNSQPGVIRGVTLLKRVLERPDVKATTWARTPAKDLFGRTQSRLGALRDALTAEPRGGTYLIDISLATPLGHDAEVIVNAVVEEYLAFARERSQQANDTVYQKLIEQKRTLETDIQQRREANRGLTKVLGTGSPSDVVSRRKAWVEDRQSKLDETRRDLALAEWQEKELVSMLEPPPAKDGAPVEAAADLTRPRYGDDPEWRRIQLDLRTLKRDMATNPRQLGPAHPDMISMRQRADLLEELLAEQQQRIDETWRVSGGKPPAAAGAVATPAAELASLRRNIGRLKKQEELLADEITRREADYETTFENAEELTRENSALRYAEEKLDLVRRRIDEKETESGIAMAIRQVATAFAPSEPDHDRRMLFSAAACVAALAAAFGAAYLRISLNPQVREVTDVRQSGRAPFLGTFPLVASAEHPTPQEAAVQNESIRVLRTALLQRLGGNSSSAVLLTSAGPGAGKTTLACLLGRSLAQIGKKVLLVDTDMHNPSVGRRLGVPASAALNDVLTGRRGDDEAILPCGTPGLSVMPAAPIGHDGDAELLANGAFGRCLARWRKQFDVILLDSPPVLPVADALIMAQEVDGAVMVVRERTCRRSQVSEALQSLMATGANILGTVFVGSRRLEHYSYRYAGGTENVAALDVRGS